MLLGAFPLAATAQDRVALVIGNSGYAHVSPLKNPANDAEDIGKALETAGFDVEIRLDLGQQDMLRALQDFGRKSFGAEMAVVYYAGHGIEVGRRNYLIPVSARLATDRDVAFETVELDRALLAVEGAKKLRLVIVDACRDNPFAGTMQQTSATRSIGRGLVAVEPSAATLVAYAAKEGTVANDGDGRNSPYAAALLEALDEPGIEIGKLFRRVRDSVMRETNQSQEPFVYGSLSAEDIYLYPAALAPLAEPEAPEEIGPMEVVFWRAISKSSDPRDFEDFLERFPESVFAGLAARRLERLTDQAVIEDAPPVQDSRVASLPASEPVTPLQSEDVEPLEITRDLVRSVQLQLNALGHDTGTPDGIIGRRTRLGISEFQIALGNDESGDIEAPFLEALRQSVSVDRAAVDHAVVKRFGVSERPGRLRGLYCLQTADGALADGRDGRVMTCHYIRATSRNRIELRSYYGHVRLSDSDPMIGIMSRLSRQTGDRFLSATGTEFTVTAAEIQMGPNLFRRVN